MKALYNFFFPFAQKDTHNLQSMRWHRLAVVLFGFILICSFLGAFGFHKKFGVMRYDGKMNYRSEMRRGPDKKNEMMRGNMSEKMPMMSGEKTEMMGKCPMSGCDMMSGTNDGRMMKCDGTGCGMMKGDKMFDKDDSRGPNLLIRLVFGLLHTIVLSYVLQLLYYKVFLYIVYGTEKK